MAIDSRSSAADLLPARVRWFLPSAGDLIFVAMFGLLAFTALSVRLLGDAGIGWHIRTGQLILATHAIPRVDPFSSTLSGRPWFAWEWLYDLFAGWLESVAGLNGVVLFTAFIIALVFSWTFRLLLRRGTNILLSSVLVMLAASASMIHFLARPHVVSWLFTVSCFWMLDSSESRRLWLLPPLMLLWVNLHGGFLVGFALLAIYWFSAAWQWLRLQVKEGRSADPFQKIRQTGRLRALTLTGLLSALATLVNPYGFHLQVHIYRYLSNQFLMDHIDEFQSPNFHYVAQKCFAGLLLLTLLALAVRRPEVPASQGLVVLFAVYTGLYASRNIPVSSLLLILVIGPWLSKAMDRFAETLAGRRIAVRWRRLALTQFLTRMETIELSLNRHLWPLAAAVVACWITAHGGHLGARTLIDAHFDARRFPVAAVNYIEAHAVQGPLLSPDFWGGFLIYRLYPRAQVVIDDRHDFYGEEFLKSYLKMLHVEPGWRDFLQHNRASAIVVPQDSALASILTETSDWQPTYRDEVAVLFERRPAPGSQNSPPPELQNPSH